MRINLGYLAILCELYKEITSRTPHRFEVICSYAKELWEEHYASKTLATDEVLINVFEEIQYLTKMINSYQIWKQL